MACKHLGHRPDRSHSPVEISSPKHKILGLHGPHGFVWDTAGASLPMRRASLVIHEA